MDTVLEFIGRRSPQWKNALLFSAVIHVLLALAIVFLPQIEKEEKKPFFARIVTPDEIRDESPSAPPQRLMPGRVPAAKTPPGPALPGGPRAPQGGRRGVAPIQPTRPSLSKAQEEGDAMTPPEGKGPSQPVPGQGGAAGEVPQGSAPRLPSASSPSLREKLFDKEVVERLAKREERKEDSSVTFDTKEFRYHGYMSRLKERIEQIWRYPPDAAMRGIYGDLYISFTILKNGRLSSVELVRTSGHRSLDEAAMQALKDGQPFWPLPDEWGKDAVEITGHFVYSIYGTYIR